MNEIIAMLVLDTLMIGLLTATVYHCFRLNIRIKVLQDSKSEFSRLIEKFDATTQRAQASIEDLQNISRKVNEQLAGRLDKANFLADDLAFMIEKGSKLADKMEEKVTGRVIPKPAAANRSESRTQGGPGSERRGAAGPVLKEKFGADSNSAADRKKASLESVLNRVTQRGDEEAPTLSDPGAQKRRASARLRSKAEQELYDALKSGNS